MLKQRSRLIAIAGLVAVGGLITPLPCRAEDPHVTGRGRASSPITQANGNNLVATGDRRIWSLSLNGVAAGDQMAVYDNTSASGNPIWEVTTGTASDSKSVEFTAPLMCDTGIYVDTKGTSTAFVEYDQQ